MKAGKESTEAREELSVRLKQWITSRKAVQFVAARKWVLLLTFMGFLLGKAMILNELSPFAIAYFAVIAFMRRDYIIPVGAALLAGSLFAPFPVPLIVASEMAIFYLLFRGLESYDRAELSYAPTMVFTTTFMVKLFAVVIGPSFSWYAMLMLTMDSVLSFVLTLVLYKPYRFLRTAKEIQPKERGDPLPNHITGLRYDRRGGLDHSVPFRGAYALSLFNIDLRAGGRSPLGHP